jgi:hypothetical protein
MKVFHNGRVVVLLGGRHYGKKMVIIPFYLPEKKNIQINQIKIIFKNKNWIK